MRSPFGLLQGVHQAADHPGGLCVRGLRRPSPGGGWAFCGCSTGAGGCGITGEEYAVVTITLNEEQSRLLSEVVESGVAHSAEEAIDHAVRALHAAAMSGKPVHQQVDNLADLFARSPFRGLNMEFEREPDTGRDIGL
jgi:hypothetical protein